MTSPQSPLRWLKPLWLSVWPLWTLVVFIILAAVRVLPAGYARAAVAAPVLLLVPGSLTLGAVFSRRIRPRGVAFVCYAALVSVVWSAFGSLILYVCGVSITAYNTYWCLLMVCAALAFSAEARLLLERPGRGRRAAGKPKITDPDLSDSDSETEQTASAKSGAYYSILAVVAGVGLLASGLYGYEHLPHPAPNGYTWMAWTGPRIQGDITIGSAGTELHFQIVHRQTNKTTFRLSASWLGGPSGRLAKPLTLTIGPNRTFFGALFVPPLPDGCTYRIVVALTAPRQIDPLTQKAPTWSINADVHDLHKSSKACKR